MSAGKIVWWEVTGQDHGKLEGFYGELFGWKLNRMDAMPYSLSECAQTGVPGGVGQAPAGPGWTTVYVGVDDIVASVAKAEKMGATVLMPITKLPDTTIAVLADPEGHPIGLAQGLG
jgi:uncharacterized protein